MVNRSERLLLCLAHRYPLYKGRGRLALSSVLRIPRAETDDPMIVRLASGEEIYVFQDDYIGRMVRFFGDLDPAVSGIVRRLLRPADVMLDVGANVGILTLQAASIVGADGHVFAFEPVRRLSDVLRRSIERNRFENVTVHDVGLSDEAGTGSMKVDRTSLGQSTLSHRKHGEACAISRLDDIDFGSISKTPRLLKIDVEGHEAHVLAGGHDFLSERRPDYVLFESHATRGPFWSRAEVRILHEHGYRFDAVSRSAFAKPRLRGVQADGSWDRPHLRFPGNPRTGARMNAWDDTRAARY